jgi:signal transduction histidine kinase
VTLDEVGGPSWAQADPGSVARIVRILIDNALRFAPQHTTINVCIGAKGDEPTIEVTDEGPGVPADEREQVFERFQRGRNSGEESGFGLGLAIGSELGHPDGRTTRADRSLARRDLPLASSAADKRRARPRTIRLRPSVNCRLSLVCAGSPK